MSDKKKDVMEKIGDFASDTVKAAQDLGEKVVKGISDTKTNLKENVFTEENIMELLDECYSKANDGISGVSESVEDMANDYLNKYDDPAKAVKAMMHNQILKCTTSGFLTGFGGFITMPVTLPANVTSVLYVQMRMIASAAYMSGLDLDDDHVQTIVYACLAGVSVNSIIKNVGKEFAIKLTTSMIKKIPGKTITKINQKVGFRFVTKFGEKGLINLGKMVPVAGAVVGGGFDLVETKVIANRAYKWFFENDFTVKDEPIDVQYDEDFEIVDEVVE